MEWGGRREETSEQVAAERDVSGICAMSLFMLNGERGSTVHYTDVETQGWR